MSTYSLNGGLGKLGRTLLGPYSKGILRFGVYFRGPLYSTSLSPQTHELGREPNLDEAMGLPPAKRHSEDGALNPKGSPERMDILPLLFTCRSKSFGLAGFSDAVFESRDARLSTGFAWPDGS